MNTKKIKLGQFFTEKEVWLQPQVINFIHNTKINKILDPFAGSGCLFRALEKIGFSDFKGFDIDKDLNWEYNDSLKHIPSTGRLIVTNPPYLAKNSARRKKLDVINYFEDNTYTDLYLIALNKCLQLHEYVVAIIPETFILTGHFVDRLESVTVLEENPFDDTEFPVCVACFNNNLWNETKVYKNDKYVGTLEELKSKEKIPHKKYNIQFNVKDGNIGLRGVDNQIGTEKIHFCFPSELNYDPDKIKISSRAISIIKIEENIDISKVIKYANQILNQYREETQDILLAAFKGNDKFGKRRRRLDFKTARAILEEAIEITKKRSIHNV